MGPAHEPDGSPRSSRHDLPPGSRRRGPRRGPPGALDRARSRRSRERRRLPGLPIAILCPRVQVHLVESRQKRHHFQREARRQLALENAFPLLGRSDALNAQPSAIVVAQAMMQPEQALLHMLPWTRPGGMMVLPATADVRPPETPDSLPVERRRYRVPLTNLERQVWIVRSSPS
ncbi:MAG: class I SAM-dependent methyltransferase [Deltaproteobacteria bacterium]|nr:class I SAM-dependent methyltransferase [Deltaproteobacteria bacterium]